MSFFNKFRKFQVVRFAAGLIAVGIVIAAISGFAIYKTATTVYETTEATVVGVEEIYNATAENENEKYSYTYFIDYEVQGQKYTNVEFGSFPEPKNSGETITIRYDVSDPTSIATEGGDYILYIVLAAGVAAFIGGIVTLVKGIRKKSDDYDEYNRVDMSGVSQQQIDAIANNDEPYREFFFHYGGRLNQSYILDDENKEPAYEAKMVSMHLLKPFVFEFVNHITCQSRTVEIGHTVTKSIGTGSGFSYSVPISSAFTVDGKNNWDYLAENGYGFTFSLEGIAPCFRVTHYGVEVAYIKTVGTNALRGKNNPIGNLPVNGLYSVKCRTSDLDMVFMVCVSIARAIFYEND